MSKINVYFTKIVFRDFILSNTMGTTIGAGTAYPSEAPGFTPGFKWGSYYSIYNVMCMFCRLLISVFLSFFFWPLCCLSLLDL